MRVTTGTTLYLRSVSCAAFIVGCVLGSASCSTTWHQAGCQMTAGLGEAGMEVWVITSETHAGVSSLVQAASRLTR